MSFDLYITTAKGHPVPPDEKLQLIQRRATDLALRAGGNHTANDIPPRDLLGMMTSYIEEDGDNEAAYVATCEQEGLAPEPMTEASALAHWSRLYGIGLCIIEMPRDDDSVRKLYANLVALCREHGLALDNPQGSGFVDLDDPGEFPPNFY